MFIHEQGAELWLQANLKPTKVKSLVIDGEQSSDANVAFYQVDLAMKKVNNVNRKSYRCDKDMSLKSFTSCAFDYLRLKTAYNNCTGTVEADLKQCSGYMAYKESLFL